VQRHLYDASKSFLLIKVLINAAVGWTTGGSIYELTTAKMISQTRSLFYFGNINMLTLFFFFFKRSDVAHFTQTPTWRHGDIKIILNSHLVM
jgi:hypothetical protein